MIARAFPLLVLVCAARLAMGADDQTRCQITFPPEKALVRAIVPVFGFADCPNFKCYRVEYGEGDNPKKWNLIRLSHEPQREDPQTAGKVHWDPYRGAKGTLANWDTGLTEYTYGQKFTTNLNGIYTLRLVVEDQAGRTSEHRIVVEVGRVVTNVEGGRPISPDGLAELNLGPWAIPGALLVVSIQPSDDVKPGSGLMPLGKIYEVQPPGEAFTRPCPLTMRYDPKKLPQGIAPKQIAIYEYQPVEEIWKPLPSQVEPETGKVSANIVAFTEYLSYYALFADQSAPSPPRWLNAHLDAESGSLGPREAKIALRLDSARQAVRLEAQSEPFSKVHLVHTGPDGKVVNSQDAQADVGGTFEVKAFLQPGANRFAAHAEDAGGNTSGQAPELVINLNWRHPASVRSLSLLGPPLAKRGDKFLVKLAGGDSTPEADATAVRVRSTGTDPDGFLLELVETGPQTGVFIRELVIGEGTDAAAGAVGARHHGEHIEVASIRDAQVRAEVKYEDRVAPPAPEITSPTHRSFCQLTFEPAEKPLGDWTGRDGVFGAALRLERDNENSHLCCRAQKAPRSVHLGSGMAMDGLDLGKFPMLEFEYRLSPRATMNLLWRFKRSDWGWKEVLLTQSKPCFGTIGQVFGAAPDGQWHAARLNLLEMARFTYPGQSSYEVEEVAFMAMVSGGWMKREFGAMPGDYDAYALDNFRVMSYSTQPDARFEFSCRDDSGIAGFSYILDQKQNTQPDTTVDEVEPVTEKESESVKAGERESGASVPLARPAAGTAAPRSAIRTPQSEISWAAKSYRGLTDGRWFFHIRALDGAGNWGPANHYEVVIDTKPPSVSFLKPEKPVSWDGSVAFQLSDETGVDPNSIRLSVVGRALDVYSRGMAYEESTGRLTYTPSRGDGDDRLIFADGEQVRVTVTAKDFAGRAAKPLVATFVSASPLKLFPPNPDGGGDWYRAMPRAELNTGPELEGKVFVEEDAAEAFLGKDRPRMVRLTVVLMPKSRSKPAQEYHKTVFVQGGRPGIEATLQPAEPDLPERSYSEPPTITLTDTARVLRPGGLGGVFYSNPDLTGPILERLDGPINFDNAGPASSKPVSGAKSSRWDGWLYITEAQKYDLEAVTSMDAKAACAANLWVNDELVLDATKREFAWSAKKEVFLTKGYHKLRLEFTNPTGYYHWLQLFWWRPDRQWRELIPAAQLYSLRSRATLYYRWDDGKPQEYRAPFKAPGGKHTLHYFAQDETGQREPEKKLELVVAEPKPEAAPAPK